MDKELLHDAKIIKASYPPGSSYLRWGFREDAIPTNSVNLPTPVARKILRLVKAEIKILKQKKS